MGFVHIQGHAQEKTITNAFGASNCRAFEYFNCVIVVNSVESLKPQIMQDSILCTHDIPKKVVSSQMKERSK